MENTKRRIGHILRPRRIFITFLFFGSMLTSLEGMREKNGPKARNKSAKCVFPESLENPFFFEINSDIPLNSVIVNTKVEPRDAQIYIGNVRSSNLPNDFYLNDVLKIESHSNGQFRVINAKSLDLPEYPSNINETLLFVTVICNWQAYPLITLRVFSLNRFAPQFYGEPYEITISRNSKAGTVVATPVLALDKDPSDRYPLSFSILPAENSLFALASSRLNSYLELQREIDSLPSNFWKQMEFWTETQLPTRVKLHLLTDARALKNSVYILNITAMDNGKPKRKVAYSQLKVYIRNEVQGRFTRTEYFANFTKDMSPGTMLVPNEAIIAEFSTTFKDEMIVYELEPNPYNWYFSIDPVTAKILVMKPIPRDIPENLELVLKASLRGQEIAFAKTKLLLIDITEMKLNYFIECYYSLHLLENPSAYTRLLQFNVRGDTSDIELLNGTDLFTVNQDGVMFVLPGVDIDREKVDHLIIKAKLKNKAEVHSKSMELCQVATVDIIIDNFNEFSPQFVQKNYNFRIDRFPYNNTEVGTLLATDGDKDEFGRVWYRIYETYNRELTSAEELPFVIFQADNVATIFYVFKNPEFIPQSSYTFTVEAYDSSPDEPRNSRVSVFVNLRDLRENEREDDTKRDDRLYAKRVLDRHDLAFNDGDERFSSDDALVSTTDEIEHRSGASVDLSDMPDPQSVVLSSSSAAVDVFGQLFVSTLSSTIDDKNRRAPLPRPILNNQPIIHSKTHQGEVKRNKQLISKSGGEGKSLATLGRHEKQSANDELEENANFTTPVAGIDDDEAKHKNDVNIEQERFDEETATSRSSSWTKAVRKPTKNKPKKKYIATEHQQPSLMTTIDSSTTSKTFIGGSKVATMRLSKYKFPCNYTFELTSEASSLSEKEYIGTIKAMSVDFGKNLEAENSRGFEAARMIEYAIEESIAGFVEIHPHTGALSIGPRFFEDNFEELRFTAAAQDPHTSDILATTLVSFFVDDASSAYNGLRPQFEEPLYRFELEENLPEQYLGKLEAHHRAVEMGWDKIWYYLLESAGQDERERNYSSLFKINQSDGSLNTIAPLDFERQKSYRLQVRACLESNATLCGHTEAFVSVHDVNDNPPRFAQSLYKVTIPAAENLPVGTELFRANATDADEGPRGRIHYSLRTSAVFENFFAIDANTGSITLAAPLMPENNAGATSYRIEVDATDEGDSPMSSSSSVQFVLNSQINPHSPQFEKFRYDVKFRGGGVLQKGTNIGRVKAIDRDTGIDGVIKYKILPQPADDDSTQQISIKDFAIDENTGTISTLSELHFPAEGHATKDATKYKEQTLQLIVEASDSSDVFPRKAQTLIVIRYSPEIRSARMIIDEETFPQNVDFIPLPKTVFIAVRKPVDTAILRCSLRTFDLSTGGWRQLSSDAKYEIKYSVYEVPIELGFFEMQNDQLCVRRPLIAGDYKLAIKVELTTGGMNRVLSAQHQMKVVVMSSGRDRYPVFEKLNYEFEIDSHAEFPLKLASLNATLAKGHISYSLYSMRESELVVGLSIDSNTGQITVFPEFLTSFGIRMEDSLPRVRDKFVVVRAVNVDAPDYYSDTGISLTVREVKPTKTTGNESRGDKLAFSLPIYQFFVIENTTPGTVLGPNAISVNRPSVHFRLGNSEFLENFDVLANGSLITRRPIDLERFTDHSNGIVDLTITASNGQNTATAQIQITVIDQNEYAPHFRQREFEFEVQTPLRVGEYIGQIVATDADFYDRQPGKLNYRAISGSAISLISIQKDGTVIGAEVAAEQPSGRYDLDVEVLDSSELKDKAKIWLIVRSEEHQLTTAAQTTTTTSFPKQNHRQMGTKIWRPLAATRFSIDNNDEQRQFTIDAPSDTQWEFRISKGNEFGHFELEQINGTTAQLAMAREIPVGTNFKNEEIVVEAVNQDDPSDTHLTNVMVDFGDLNAINKSNENVPLESHNKTITIYVDSEQDPEQMLSIFTIPHSQTGPTKVEFELEENPKDVFYLDKKGQLFLKNTTKAINFSAQNIKTIIKQYDPETNATVSRKSFNFYLVFAPKTTTTATQNISSFLLNSTTESTPTTSIKSSSFLLSQYHFIVDHPQNDGIIGQFGIANIGPFSRLSVSIEPPQFRSWFRVDPRTAMLFLREVPKLVGRQRAEFKVRLDDQSDATNATVAEVIVDLNLPQHFSITTNVPATTDIASTNLAENENVTQTTANVIILSNKPSTLPPSIVEKQPEHSMSIDEETNEMSTSDNRHNLSTLSTAFTIAPNLFYFAHEKYSAMLSEGHYHGAQLTLKPQPLDTGLPSGTIFSLYNSPSELPFFVRNETGELIAFGEIDREKTSSYEFRIHAHNSMANQSAEALIYVDILDVNDNYPQFVGPIPKILTVGRQTPVGTKLIKFVAVDSDADRFGKVGYRLEGSPEHLFRIDETKGDLILASHIPREIENGFNVSVIAIDGGRPALRTEHALHVEIFDEFEFPKFDQHEYDIGKIDGSQALNGTFIANLVAGIEGKTRYALIDPSNLDLFDIVSETGKIFLKRPPFAAEQNRQWVLNVSAFFVDDEKHASSMDSAIVKVFFEGPPKVTVFPNSLSTKAFALKSSTTLQPQQTSATPTTNNDDNLSSKTTKLPRHCGFDEKVFTVEIKENLTKKKQLITALKGNKDCAQKQLHFEIVKGSSDAFHLDASSGEIYAVKPLDREQKSVHFIVVNVSIVAGNEETEILNDAKQRTKRQQQTRYTRDQKSVTFNDVLEHAKSTLAYNQALVVVRVIDENDNAPQFQKLTSEGQYVFAVDWQASALQTVGLVHAKDADEQPPLTYTILQQNSDNLLSINKTSGAIHLTRSLYNDPENEFGAEVMVTDGRAHNATAPVKIYKLQPGTNIVLVTANQPVNTVNELEISRTLTKALSNLDVFVLVKQIWVGPDGKADPKRTHLLVWASDHQTKVPIAAERLKDKIERKLSSGKDENNDTTDEMKASKDTMKSLHLASVMVPEFVGPSSSVLSNFIRTDVILVAVMASIVLMVCCLMLILLQCCKKKQLLITKANLEYMVDTQTAGPRPYNVQLISRKAAQEIFANRSLPEPKEEWCTLSAESRAAMIVAASGVYRPGDLHMQQTHNARLMGGDKSDEPQLQLGGRVRLGPASSTRKLIPQHKLAAAHMNQGYENEFGSLSSDLSMEKSPDVAKVSRNAPLRKGPPISSPRVRHQQGSTKA